MAYEELKSKIPDEGNRCKKLCGKCCTNAVPVGQREADEIVAWLNGNQTDEALTKQFHHFDEHPTQCPFLMPDKGCFIYPARPMPCRTFGHLEDAPLAPKHWSQKCPEGVDFTEVKFTTIADLLIPWMEDYERGTMPTLNFRMVELQHPDGTTGDRPGGAGECFRKDARRDDLHPVRWIV